MQFNSQNTFLAFVLICMFCMQHTVVQAAAVRALNPYPKLVIISFDGFRSDYLSKTETPTLDALAKNGVTVPYMKAQFSTKTFPNHQSISTGMFTETHGIVDNTVFDPLYNRTQTGFVEYNDEFWNFDDNVVPIWILNEWAGNGRISGVQFPACNQHFGQNRTLPKHFLVYDGSRPYLDRMEAIVQWLTDKDNPANLVFMYFEQPDTAGHAYGPESEEVKEQIRQLDWMTTILIERLKYVGIYDDVNLIFLSDHGMQEVNVGNRINLTEIVGTDRQNYDRYGGSPIFHIAPKPGKYDEVYAAFKSASEGKPFQVYQRDEIPAKWRFQQNRRIMPIIVVADPGYVFDDFRPSITDPNLKFGVHGYDSDADSMKPFFLAHGPAFKRGFVGEPFENVDLFPLIANMMGFGLGPHNGTFSNIQSILASGTTTTTTAATTTSNGNSILPKSFILLGPTMLLHLRSALRRYISL